MQVSSVRAGGIVPNPDFPISWDQLFDDLPILVAIFDRDSNLLYGSPFYRKLPPVSSEELIPSLPSQRAMANAASLACLGEVPHWLEMGRATDSGIAVWYHGTAHPLRNVEGRVIAAAVICFDVTEQKKTEAELKRRQGLLIDAQSVAHLGTWEWDLATRQVTWSPQLYRIYGVRPLDYQPTFEGYLNLVHPDDRQRVKSLMERALRENQPFSHDERVLWPDGSVRFLHSWGTPVLNEHGKPVRLSGVCQDITERKLLEEKVRSEERLRGLIFDTVDDVLFYLGIEPDSRFRFLSINDAFLKATGLARDQVIGRFVEEVIPEPSLSMVLDKYRRAIREHRTYHWDEVSVYPAGTRHGEVSVTPVFAKDGMCTGIVGTVHDITDRKRSEARIAEQAALLDHARDAIMLRDLDGTIRYWNEGAARLYGWSSEEALGQKVTELYYRTPEQFEIGQAKVVDEGYWSGEISQFTKTGSEITIEARWTLIRDAQERPRSVLAINTDITERKQLQAQLEYSQRVEGLGNMARGIAHDFNNILTIILGNLEIARNAMDPSASARGNIEVALKACRRADDLIAQILSFGRQHPEKRKLHLQSVIDDALELLRASVPAMVRIRTHWSNGIPEVLADPTQIHQIIMNLGLNAVHAMSGSGTLAFRLESVTLKLPLEGAGLEIPPGRYARLSVEDSGIGMDETTLSRIFDPFFSTKGPEQGSGIGLPVVRGIVKEAGGTIVVTSRRGHGSVFQIYLPEARATKVPSERPEHAPLPVIPGYGERILYVDKEASILALTVQMLETIGYRVSGFTDPTEALKVFKAGPKDFDAVVTDADLPGMSGAELAEAILRLRPEVPVILTSGHPEAIDELTARRIGIRKILKKPGSIDALKFVLNQLFLEHPKRTRAG